MGRRKASTLLNLTGVVFTGVSSLCFVYPAFTLRFTAALVLIITGSILQSKLARFDIYGVTYVKWIEEKVMKMSRVNTAPSITLRGSKALSTVLNFLGIPLLVVGFYLVITPVFSLRLALAAVLLVVGVYLQVKFRPFLAMRSLENDLL